MLSFTTHRPTQHSFQGLRAMANPTNTMQTASLSTATRLDQAYRIEADTFGELKVRKKSGLWEF